MIGDTLTQQVEEERSHWDERNVALASLEQSFENADEVSYIFDIFGAYIEVEDQIIVADATDDGLESAVLAVLEAFRTEESKQQPSRYDKIDMDDMSVGVAGDDDKLFLRFLETDANDELTPFGTWLQALIDANNDEWLSKSPQHDDEDAEDDERDDDDGDDS